MIKFKIITKANSNNQYDNNNYYYSSNKQMKIKIIKKMIMFKLKFKDQVINKNKEKTILQTLSWTLN